jgi:hypothetical protein
MALQGPLVGDPRRVAELVFWLIVVVIVFTVVSALNAWMRQRGPNQGPWCESSRSL